MKRWHAEAVELARTGEWTLDEIGRRFGVSCERVRQVLAEAGIRQTVQQGWARKRERRHPRELRDRFAARALEVGATTAAEEMGVNVGTAYRWPEYRGSAPRWQQYSGIPDEELRYLYEELGWSTSEIAGVLDLAISGVTDRLHRAGVRLRPPGPTKGGRTGGSPFHDLERAKKVRAAIHAGWSTREIMTEYGVTPSTVTYWRKKQ